MGLVATLTAPHRLAFFTGGVGLALVALWWLVALAVPVPWAVARPVAHGLAMALAFMPPFMVGFMFTAGPRWLGVQGPEARALLAPMLIWAAGLGAGAGGFSCLGLAGGVGLALAALAWARWLGRFVALVMQSEVPDQLHARARPPPACWACWPCCSAQPVWAWAHPPGASGGTAGALGLCGARVCRRVAPDDSVFHGGGAAWA